MIGVNTKNYMTALSLIKQDFKETAETMYKKENRPTSVKEMIEMYNYSSKELKEEVYQVLRAAYEDGKITTWFWNDNCDIEESDSNIISYRNLARDIRKIVF
jgi:hypothetical protein